MLGEIGLAPVKSEKSLDEVKKEPLNKIEKDRLIVVGVLAFFSIFFWAAFEQAGSSMNIFASKHTDRQLVSNGHYIV